jgi:hypothetical protein
MKQREQRRFIRYDSLHLLDFIVLDEQGHKGLYSMGRTLDVSLDGIKLETVYPLKENSHLLVTIGLEEDLIDIEGVITHTFPRDGRYLAGVNFIKINGEGRRVVAKYIDAFRQKKQETGDDAS